MKKLEQYLHRQPDTVDDGSPRLLREVAYERLKDAIRHADLQPGDPLSESRISRALGISRTPVREALQQLAQEGLVQIIPGRAITVAAPSVQDVLNGVHVRSLLEPELARLVAESVTPGELEPLWDALRDMEAAVEDGDRVAWSKADTRFHDVLCDLSPNELLGQLVLTMRNRVHYTAAINSQTSASRITACTAEHREVVETIASGDGEASERAMRRHIDELRDSLFKRLAHG